MIGERLQELRKDRSISQKELALQLGISFHTVSSYERDRSMPNDEIKIKIAQLFNVSLDYLLGLIDYPAPYQKDEYCLTLPKKLPPQAIEEIQLFIEFIQSKYDKYQK